MLSEPLNLGAVDVGQLFDYLYGFFKRDFVENRTYLNQCIYINPQSQRQEDDKEKSFWHLTSRHEKYNVKEGNRYVTKVERLPDFRRSERIEWVKQIIENHDHAEVRCFYHKETTGSKPIRFYMWAHDADFVVILQKLGRSSSFLVTSFYIDKPYKRKTYQKRYDDYQSNSLAALNDCEWF